MKILVVDDSSTMRKVITRALEDMGHADAVEAGNGKAALEALEAGGCGLVITDWHMPVMSGVDFVKRLRPLYPGLPVLMVTTNSAPQDVEEALKAGVTGHVIKPFTVEGLQAKVRKIIG